MTCLYNWQLYCLSTSEPKKRFTLAAHSAVSVPVNHEHRKSTVIFFFRLLRPHSPPLRVTLQYACLALTCVTVSIGCIAEYVSRVPNFEYDAGSSIYRLYGEVNSVKNTTINIWLNDGVYWHWKNYIFRPIAAIFRFWKVVKTWRWPL